MSNFYISDTHFGCVNSYENRTLEHDKLIKDNWNSVVTNADTVYILGDIGRFGGNKDNEYLLQLISTLRGKKVLVKGNHDRLDDLRVRQLFTEICDYKEITDTFDGKSYKLVLSHYPILMWNGQHGTEKKPSSIHLYGHLHTTREWKIYEECINKLNKDFLENKNAGSSSNEPIIAINCGSMIWDYTPMTLKDMLNLYEYKRNYYLNELTYYYIYKHTNAINNKSYIGITSLSPNNRWRKNGDAYLRKNKNGEFYHKKFANAIQKYGWDNFRHEIIDEGFFTKDEIEEHEIYWISYYDSYNNGYNSTLGGNISLWSATKDGRSLTSLSVKKMWKDEQYKRHNTTPVKCLDNEYVFKSANEISDILDIEAGGIRSCCNNKQKTAGGYCWEWSSWDEYDRFFEQKPNYIEIFLESHQKLLEESQKKTIKDSKKEKPVLCVDKDVAYQGQVAAGIITGIDRSGIGLCCLNKQNKSGGYEWKFIEEDEYLQYKRLGKADKPIPLIRSSQKIPVICVETGVIYESIADAYKHTGIRHIGECCRGQLNTVGGYHWEIKSKNIIEVAV